MDVKVKVLEGGILPKYKTAGASCLDCYSRLEAPVEVISGKTVKIPLGFCLELPFGWEAVIRPRSSVSSNGVICYNHEGTIDSDYRGEVMAMLHNLSKETFVVNPGDRVCQMRIQEAERVNLEVVDELSETERGSGGFGSTGR